MDVPNADTIRAIEDVRMGRNISRLFFCGRINGGLEC